MTLDFIHALAYACCGAILLAIALWFKTFGLSEFKANVRAAFFYFRWFLIGKYHCPVDKKTKLFYKGCNRIFWGFVIVAVTLLVADILEYLTPSMSLGGK